MVNSLWEYSEKYLEIVDIDSKLSKAFPKVFRKSTQSRFDRFSYIIVIQIIEKVKVGFL